LVEKRINGLTVEILSRRRKPAGYGENKYQPIISEKPVDSTQTTNQEEEMIYELRIYEAIPASSGPKRTLAKITMGYFEKYGLKMVGFWTDESA